MRRKISKGDWTNWVYKMYKVTERAKDTLQGYRIDNLPKRYNEASLKKTKIKMREIKCCGKTKYHLDQIKISLSNTSNRNQFIC